MSKKYQLELMNSAKEIGLPIKFLKCKTGTRTIKATKGLGFHAETFIRQWLNDQKTSGTSVSADEDIIWGGSRPHCKDCETNNVKDAKYHSSVTGKVSANTKWQGNIPCTITAD
jgi:hypothetical protein